MSNDVLHSFSQILGSLLAQVEFQKRDTTQAISINTLKTTTTHLKLSGPEIGFHCNRDSKLLTKVTRSEGVADLIRGIHETTMSATYCFQISTLAIILLRVLPSQDQPLQTDWEKKSTSNILFLGIYLNNYVRACISVFLLIVVISFCIFLHRLYSMKT